MLKLNMGSGGTTIKGFKNVDVNPNLADICWDLRNTPYPFDDRSVNYIVAHHIVEHLYAHENLAFMDECWRILEDGGKLELIFPKWDSKYAWIDPTHVRAIHPDQYDYFTRHKGGNGYTDKFWHIEVNTWQSGKDHRDFQVVILSPDR